VKDYRETRQIVICGVPAGEQYSSCAGYMPYSKSRGLMTCVYCSGAFDHTPLCARPEGGTGKEGPESEIDGCIAEARAMSKACGRMRRIREMP
jgi:hypothetical protein